jgi:hypothetical protein
MAELGYGLPILRDKRGVDRALQTIEDRLVVLRFGRAAGCLDIDDVVSQMK